MIGPQVLKGSNMVDGDTPSSTDVKLAYQHYYNQLIAVPGAGDFYVALNNHAGPFANVNVRKAMWAALDREAMVKASGGEIVGAPGTHFLYPGSLGFEQAGGDHGPNVDYNNYVEGNLTVAKKYMKLAYPSTNGVPPSSITVKVVGSTGEPAAETAAIANHAVQQLGFKTNFTLVDQPVMYGKYCGVPKQEIDVCPNVGWIRDWSDPQTLLDPTFAGYNMVATNNSNWGQVSWQDFPKGSGRYLRQWSADPDRPGDEVGREGGRHHGPHRRVGEGRRDARRQRRRRAVVLHDPAEPEVGGRPRDQ